MNFQLKENPLDFSRSSSVKFINLKWWSTTLIVAHSQNCYCLQQMLMCLFNQEKASVTFHPNKIILSGIWGFQNWNAYMHNRYKCFTFFHLTLNYASFVCVCVVIKVYNTSTLSSVFMSFRDHKNILPMCDGTVCTVNMSCCRITQSCTCTCPFAVTIIDERIFINSDHDTCRGNSWVKKCCHHFISSV